MSNELMTEAQQQLAAIKAAKAQQQSTNALTLTEGPKNKITLLVDLSGSMAINFYSMSRADAAKKAMDRIIGASNSKETAYGLVSFTHEAYQIHKMGSNYGSFLTTKFYPTGGTNIFYGLRRALDQKPTRVIVLSDGETSMQHECTQIALTEYQPKGIKIDCIAIGEAKEQFLVELCELTGGHFQRAANPEELEKTFLQLEPNNYLQLEHK